MSFTEIIEALAHAEHNRSGINYCPAGLGHNNLDDCPQRAYWIDGARALVMDRRMRDALTNYWDNGYDSGRIDAEKR